MGPRRQYELVYSPVVKEHLKAIEPKFYSLIRDTITTQLSFEPGRVTRNRKPLKRLPETQEVWEIRFGRGNRFRVFYQVDQELGRVYVLAVGEKKGGRLLVAGQEVER